MEKPAPVIAAELTVTAEVPVEVRVKAWVVAVFTVTLPKLRVAALKDKIPALAPIPCIDSWATGCEFASNIVTWPE